MGEARPRPIYTIGAATFAKGVVYDTLERNGAPYAVLAAHAQGPSSESEWRTFLDHLVATLNQAAGT